jgi:CO dehydrogenase/acetyl-CoA synthase gamma subunit (corrinoid Fe-S protein)
MGHVFVFSGAIFLKTGCVYAFTVTGRPVARTYQIRFMNSHITENAALHFILRSFTLYQICPYKCMSLGIYVAMKNFRNLHTFFTNVTSIPATSFCLFTTYLYLTYIT